MATNVSEVAFRVASKQGLEIVFANPGTSEMFLVGALDRVSSVRSVLALQENVCSGAADGYDRMRGRPSAAVLLHLGPGLSNAMANLHNAKRAGTPLVVIVGEMSTWLQADDPLLGTDIEALARTFSREVLVAAEPGSLPRVLAKAFDHAAKPSEGPGESRIVTVIAPHDRTWEEDLVPSGEADLESEVTNLRLSPGLEPAEPAALGPEFEEAVQEFALACADALQTRGPGEVLVFLGSEALGDPECITLAGKVAKATGGVLMGENVFARSERGAGLPHVQRCPYFPQDALRELSKFKEVLLIHGRRPVPMFGYKDLLGASGKLPQGATSFGSLLTQDEDNIWEVDQGSHVLFLRILVARLGAKHLDVAEPPSRPPLPPSAVRLSPSSLCQVVAALQPEGLIMVDESLTSGGPYYDFSRGCPRFSHLCLTGGAIGSGPCMALGAALACPDRVVINLQGEGSFLYTPQALWSQAKEGARVITLICNNRNYQILKLELAKQGVPSNGTGFASAAGGGRSVASKALTTLGGIDFVGLAEAMGVSGCRVATCGELAEALQKALTREEQGPVLIECIL